MLAPPRLRLIPVAALLCLALASCGWDERGPNIRLPGGTAQSPSPSTGSGTAPVPQVSSASQASAAARLAYPADGRHTVQSGESLFDIARGYGLPLRAMIEANQLEPPYALRVGQVLTLPPPNVHVVQRGETLYSVSRRYGTAVSELARLNGLAEPFTIFVGQALSIPGRVEPEPPAIATIPSPGPAEVAPEPPPPQDEGQTVTPSLADTPDDSLPGELASRPPERPAPPGRAASPADAGAQQRPTVNSEAVAIPSPAARDASTFLWPVRGRILSAYGPKNGGLHNDGINIAAPRGTPIRAAENGVVAYAGNQLEGFGNLILVRHADGYMTAYAHAEALLVERGQTVKRGQTIGRVGSTGNVDTPQLHFEVRRGTAAVDPTRFLGD